MYDDKWIKLLILFIYSCKIGYRQGKVQGSHKIRSGKVQQAWCCMHHRRDSRFQFDLKNLSFNPERHTKNLHVIKVSTNNKDLVNIYDSSVTISSDMQVSDLSPSTCISSIVGNSGHWFFAIVATDNHSALTGCHCCICAYTTNKVRNMVEHSNNLRSMERVTWNIGPNITSDIVDFSFVASSITNC